MVPGYRSGLRSSARVRLYRVIGTGYSSAAEREGGNRHQRRRSSGTQMRIHANFAEYVPFALLLATFIEMQGTRAGLIHLLCLALVAGRVIHAYGVSQEHENFRLRMAGMATTLTVLAVMAVWLLMGAIGRSWP
jgi:uncharacterized membrane protein YecN with MAPEG domain